MPHRHRRYLLRHPLPAGLDGVLEPVPGRQRIGVLPRGTQLRLGMLPRQVVIRRAAGHRRAVAVGQVVFLIGAAGIGIVVLPVRAEKFTLAVAAVIAALDMQAILVRRTDVGTADHAAAGAAIARIDAHAAALHGALLGDRRAGRRHHRRAGRVAALHRAGRHQALLGAREVDRLLALTDAVLLRRALLRTDAGLAHAGAALNLGTGPAAGAPQGFVLVDVDGIELLDDVGGAVGLLQAVGVDRQHHVAAIERLGV